LESNGDLSAKILWTFFQREKYVFSEKVLGHFYSLYLVIDFFLQIPSANYVDHFFSFCQNQLHFRFAESCWLSLSYIFIFWSARFELCLIVRSLLFTCKLGYWNFEMRNWFSHHFSVIFLNFNFNWNRFNIKITQNFERNFLSFKFNFAGYLVSLSFSIFPSIYDNVITNFPAPSYWFAFVIAAAKFYLSAPVF